MKPDIDAWNAVTKERRERKKTPMEEVAALHDRFRIRRAKKILDLGCGSGRHLIYFAKLGYEVYGIDVSPQAIRLSREWLTAENLKANLYCGDMQQLPWAESFFEAVFSVQVIEHNHLNQIQKIIKEVSRVTQAGGYFFAVVKKYPPRKDWKDGNFVKLKGHLYAPTEGTEKGILHYFFAADELKNIFAGFEIMEIREDNKGEHYCVLAQK